MKVTLDLDKLLHEGKITDSEYAKFSELSAQTLGSLAFNILIGFGVIAVSGASLALIPTAATAMVIGSVILLGGLIVLHKHSQQWLVLANICTLIGALMAGSGAIAHFEGSAYVILAVAAFFTLASYLSKSALLAVLAVLTLSSSIGAQTGYFHASYVIVIKEPAITVVLFSALAVGLYQLSKILKPDDERIALIAARTSVFIANMGFWVGSLWGVRNLEYKVVIPSEAFAIMWALALLATGIWAWKRNRRWVVNTVAVFGGIHFYTQWFEYLDATPETVLIGGTLALLFAYILKTMNEKLKSSDM
ncbi:hypothetical protein J3998_05715 [Thiomicrorhabdus sp. 6S2-11]|uniref:DUF2157 domain-containing protein n=1 Tax=Thiomicrorhabdus marina TaxID=2818442 RepID=A0ABS3Q529_9GAMM|nr:hypothetical protein [Thiomicrorhabdus marina]MBO1927069.1 hypothetical protein [Thiomicrorhabdus marina]